MLIHITRADITTALTIEPSANICTTCPTAIAIRKYLKKEYMVTVSYDWIIIQSSKIPYNYYKLATPDEIKEFIRSYDRVRHLSNKDRALLNEASFNLALPNTLLKVKQ